MKYFDYNEYLGMACIKPGQIVDISSALSSVKRFAEANDLRFEANDLIDELKKIVGHYGTVMIRTFSWQFCKGIAFNPRETLSEVGALGNVAMLRNDFIRTKHPLYSWMVWGYFQDELCGYRNIDGFGPDSIFSFLEEKKAIQLLLGKQKVAGLTMGHYAEVKERVPYRKKKFFEADYYDDRMNISRRKYSMYVKPLNFKVDYRPREEKYLKEIFEENGISNNYFYKKSLPISTIDLAKASAFISNDIRNNDGKLTVKVNGVEGIRACGIDWSTAIF